jgi:tRNA(fMet)-specific endonuclease VapC
LTVAFLLDTGIVSDLVRNPRGLVALRVTETGAGQIFTSVIVTAELRFGAVKRASPALSERIEGAIARMQVLPFESPADKRYAELRARLERIGRPIGGNDMLIAAHALALGHTLVTDNVSEFSRVEGLQVENWLR